MPAPNVTVRRQVLDVDIAGTQADGLALQRRLPALWADTLSPAVEAGLAHFDPGGAHLYVERLEISIGCTALDRLADELAEAVRREIADYLRRHPPTWPTAGITQQTDPVRLRREAATIDDALVIFLRSGQLPWSFELPPGTRLEQVIAEAWSAVASDGGVPAATLCRLAEALAARIARTRLLLQFTPAFVSRLLRAWSPRLVNSVGEMRAALGSTAASTIGAAFLREVWDVALQTATGPGLPDDHADSEGQVEAAQLARTAWRRLTDAEQADSALVGALEKRWPGVTGLPSQTPAETWLTPHQARATPQTAADSDESDESDSILVVNAGVVLLHPYLPRFLGALGAARDDDLVDPVRALNLLHHLATGDLTAPEHQLVLAKVLCEMPLDQPIRADAGLTRADIAEATALLEAAVRHWTALRGAAPDALRGEFLQRPGLLTSDPGGGWLLTVESRTTDILLDQLPWGVSMVKLPWMSQLMRVEWR